MAQAQTGLEKKQAYSTSIELSFTHDLERKKNFVDMEKKSGEKFFLPKNENLLPPLNSFKKNPLFKQN